MTDIKKRLNNLSPEQRELLLKKLKQKKPARSADAILPRPNQNEYPLSASQERVWFLQQLEPKSPFYIIPSALRLEGRVDTGLIEKSINEVIRRHEVLGAYYPTNERGEPTQRIEAERKITIAFTDLSGMDESEAESRVHQILRAEASRPFDITKFPLIRARLIQISGTKLVISLNIHHLNVDGWSLGVFIREFSAIYRSFAKHSPSPLPEPRLQYADYAWWQKSRLQDNTFTRQLEYWRKYLAGMPTSLELITDKTRPAVPTFKGRQHNFRIDAALTTQLRNFSKTQQASLFMIMMAAFQVLINKISGQDDFGVGAPVANRNRRELEDIIGFFVNTIVLRADFRKDVSFSQLIKRVSKEIAVAADNQDIPFEKIVEAIQPGHDLSRLPLFQVLFDYQRAPFESLQLGDLTLRVSEIELEISKFELMILMTELDKEIVVTLEYSTDLFESGTIARFGQYFLNLIRAFLADPQKKVSSLSLIDEAEKHELLTRWNATQREYPRDLPVQVIFEQQVSKYGDSIALSFPQEHLTYQQLNIRANRLARHLKSLNLGQNDKIALYLERQSELFICILGILKIGAVYVPLDTAYPKDRVGFMVRDAECRALITQQSLVNQLPDPPSQTRLIILEEEQAVISAQEQGNIPALNSGADPAYIIYTSGSTGIPKGVVVPHRAISRLVINTDYVPFGPGMRIAQISNASFDAATMEIWGALLTGGTLVGFEKETVLSTSQFAEQLRAKKINVAFITTALFNQIVRDYPDAFGSIDYLLSGGDAADVQTFRKVLQAGRPATLLNAYGPTENTTYSTTYRVQSIEERVSFIPIGKAIANSYHYILDNNLQPVPVQVPGELYLGGDGLALGYHNRPELTAERFLKDPYSQNPDARLYKTGDLACYLPDGNVRFLGRIDQQVKIRGFRVELGEIESTLKKFSEIKDAVVIDREDMPGAKQLVGYYVPSSEKMPQATLRAMLAETLPDYMIPSFFIAIDEIPLTPNGKVDRRALPAPQGEADDRGYVPPRNQLEEYLVQAWQDILGIEKIGIQDNFFDLGGNSLKAAVFANRLQKKFDQVVHVGAVFKAPRICDLAAYIQEYYPDIVRLHFGDLDTVAGVGISVETDSRKKRIDETDLKTFSDIITPLAPFRDRSDRKNDKALFILSPPRSGSTLLRIMLAGNKKLFSPPELDLLSFNTLGERKKAFSHDGLEIWLEATIRAIMEIKGLDFASAKNIMEELEDKDLPTKEFYGLLQQWLDGRMIVDKTPTYAFDANILDRAEREFNNPVYIHLVRHPYAMIYSFIEAKLDQNFFRYHHNFSRQQLAELIWLTSHRNIVHFCESIPDDRVYRMYFENLVTDPGYEMKKLCAFLNIEFEADMLKPYEGKKMTDGATAGSQMVGDFKFYLHRNINSDVAHKWKKFHKTDFLSDISWDLARQFGYDIEKDLAYNSRQIGKTRLDVLSRVNRDQALELSFAQQRLWFLNEMDPANANYNIPGAIRLKGQIDFQALQNSLNFIITRHETLRTLFRKSEEGRASQVILPRLKIKIETESLLDLEKEKREEQARAIADHEAARPFNLEIGPLIRARLVQISDDESVLIVVMHHIISDGWSTNIFIQELSMIYSALVQGKQPALPELPVQYVDYAYWQRDWLQGPLVEQQLNYWKNQLAGLPPSLDLPLDYPRPQMVRHEGQRIVFQIEEPLLSRLKQFSKKHQITLYMTLLSLFQTLLYRYSQQDDFAIGTPVSGRMREEIESLIGFFVNTLVIRSDLSDNPDFIEVLKRTRRTVTDAFDHQDIPFEKLVDSIQPERDMSHTPLFQVMFAYQKTGIQELELPNLSLKPFNISSGTAKFDLVLELIEHNDRIASIFEFRTDLFRPSTIRRMIRNFLKLIDSVLENPGQKISSLSMLAEDERQTLLTRWNTVTLDYDRQACLHHMFEAQARVREHENAVTMYDQALTFGQLNTRANQLAHYLLQKGVQREELVGILMDRSPQMIVAILAILKAGCAWLPLDPSYPAERIEFILNDARAPILITDAHISFANNDHSEVINLSQMAAQLESMPAEAPEVSCSSSQLAYVIYTSGSTGNPKGVMIEHRSAMNLAANLRTTVYERFKDRKLRISLNAPIAFDASVQQIVMLFEGHSLFIIPDEVRADGLNLLKYIRNYKIEILDCVPSQLKLLLDTGLLDGDGWKPLALLPGGEAIDDQTWQLLNSSKRPLFFNMYGPTECTVDSTICPVWESGPTPVIGKPVANARFYILDENGQPVPIGVAGELHISGEGVARGYLNQPELTAEKFIPNPFDGSVAPVLYKTGDLVRFLEDGNVQFLGRVDHQVKIRGFRMELGEIESALNTHPQVKDSVVIARKFEQGQKRLVAYVIPLDNDHSPGISQLRKHLQSNLPDYMIPAAFMFLDAFPLLPNGKVNRRLLPEPEFDRENLESTFVAPQSDTEIALVKIWQEVLGVDKIGILDNFFELGGDSILTIQVVSRARQAGLNITPRQLFEHPTIQTLAGVAGKSIPVHAEQGLVKGTLPLTPIQQDFFERKLDNPNHWNQSLLLDVAEELDPDILEKVCDKILKHHDVLRLRFHRTDEGWQQKIVQREGHNLFTLIDVSQLEPSGQIKEISRIESQLQASLNLEKGPVIRIAYFRRSAEYSNQLLIVIHHLAIDGVSWRILTEDIQLAYSQLVAKQPLQLQAKTTSFKFWAGRLTQYALSEEIKSELQYWLQLPAGSQTVLPLDHPHGQNLEKTSRLIQGSLPADITNTLLREANAAYNTHITDLLLSGLLMAFHKWTGRTGLSIKMEGHGRENIFEDTDLSRTVGWFTTLYPVFLSTDGHFQFADVITRVKEQLRAVPANGFHFGLLRHFHPDQATRGQLAKISGAPVTFNYLGQFDQSLDEGGRFTVNNDFELHERDPQSERDTLLDISASIRMQKLTLSIQFSSQQFQGQTIENFLNDYLNTLTELTGHCAGRKQTAYTPSDFKDVSLNQDELEQMLDELE